MEGGNGGDLFSTKAKKKVKKFCKEDAQKGFIATFMFQYARPPL